MEWNCGGRFNFGLLWQRSKCAENPIYQLFRYISLAYLTLDGFLYSMGRGEADETKPPSTIYNSGHTINIGQTSQKFEPWHSRLMSLVLSVSSITVVLAIPEFQINFTSFFYSSVAQELK